jgi:hypothetical protein
MSSTVSKLISILFMSAKRERKPFPAKVKYQILVTQKKRCATCKGYMERLDREFDHKNGDRSNNKMSNCQALHTRCHRKKTVKAALKKWSFFNL